MLMMPYKEDCLSQPYCQMTSIRQVVFFISVFTTVATLKCYSDVVNGDDMPVGTTNCTLSKYCAKPMDVQIPVMASPRAAVTRIYATRRLLCRYF
nr:unnamed protein product [Haemonchus contortus]